MSDSAGHVFFARGVLLSFCLMTAWGCAAGHQQATADPSDGIAVTPQQRPNPELVHSIWDEDAVAFEPDEERPAVDEAADDDDDLLDVELEEEFADVLPPEEEPETEEPWDARALEAFAAARADVLGSRYSNARRTLQTFLDHEDRRVRSLAQHNLGVVAWYEGDHVSAESAFRRAMDEDPGQAAPLRALVRLYLADGQHDHARSLVREQVTLSEEAASIRAVELLLLLEEGRDQEVEELSRALLLEDGANLDIFEALAFTQLNAQRLPLAEYIAEQGLERDETRTELWYVRAVTAMERGDNLTAIRHLETARERGANTRQPELLNLLGVLYLRTLRWEDAQRVLEEATRAAPSYADAWVNLGNAHVGLRDYDAALVAYTRGRDLGLEGGGPLFNLGLLYMEPGWEHMERIAQLREAIEFFDRFAAERGDIPESHLVHEYRREALAAIEGMEALARPREQPVEPVCDDPFGCDDEPVCDDPFGCD
ncbi:MAG: tetratricopeptide repeat protein [Deltaproteobacteria bacterium]|nr:MAG: tetratricopeptide repeat protein [Deltaproteobacteria bacterium]